MIRDRRARGQTLFIAAGGDGTVNHVIQGVANTEAAFAVIPVGTYNHFARDLEIPLDWREALQVAAGRNERQVDAARVNERLFVNNVSLGLYPELVARREERGRDDPRWKARLLAFSATMRKYQHVSLTIDSEHHHEVIRTHVFMVSNNSYDLTRMGVEASRQTLEEGRLSVYWLPHMPRIALMRHAGHYLAGKVQQSEGFRSFRTRRMKVQSPRPSLRLGIDGELFAMQTPLTITSMPRSLLVKVPG
ncbi:MAG TPA: diacylglycerol kinase family protein [Thermoanaerobaculia bacterium]|nr:diacylglycerol kinase family protein [Thermoanaerobaculia bacterium]